MSRPHSEGRRIAAPLRISLLYALFGAAWILLSDRELFRGADSSGVLLLSIGKGLLFVLGSAVLIYFMVRREARAEHDAETARRRVYKLEAVGRLAASVAHEFNNILTTVLGHATLLGEAAARDAGVREHTDQIGRAAQRAATLTRQLLVMSGQNVTRLVVLDTGATLRALEPAIIGAAGAAVKTRISIGPGVWPLRADPAELQQVLLNLVMNARDAMPQGGELRIDVANHTVARSAEVAAGDYVRLAITDSGHGMGSETLERLFEPFFTTKEHAAGLGLATVRGVVKHAGGLVRVHSRTGRGTTFEILWPRAADAPAPSELLPAPSSGRARPRTVLLAEDDDAVRQLTTRILERQGHFVIPAGSGEAALAAAGNSVAPDLLVADIVMPGITGLELARLLRERYPALPVLLTSGYAGGSFLSETDLPPETAFLEKPFQPAQLLASINGLLYSAG